jgi:hypothetical protein
MFLSKDCFMQTQVMTEDVNILGRASRSRTERCSLPGASADLDSTAEGSQDVRWSEGAPGAWRHEWLGRPAGCFFAKSGSRLTGESGVSHGKRATQGGESTLGASCLICRHGRPESGINPGTVRAGGFPRQRIRPSDDTDERDKNGGRCRPLTNLGV